MALMEECLVMLDFSPRQTNDMLDLINRHKATKLEIKLSSWTLEDEKKYWKDYRNDKIGFYKKCGQIVSQLSRKEFKILLGDHGKNLWEVVKKDIDKIKSIKAENGK
jgi:hypothetical protein